MRLLSCFCTAFVTLAVFACSTHAADNKIPDNVKEAFAKADSFDLYSLDPVHEADKPKDGFHGWKVLGKTTIKDADTRKKLIAALEKGVAENATPANCFNPRHGIRVVHDGKTYDLVICFECNSAEVYVSDKKEHGFVLTASPQPTFNKVLTDAKVPLPEKKDK